MAADPSNKSPYKKSFQLKMCKKVAELTQVVHMLFTKNHEREIEIAKMIEEYEREIGKLVTAYEEKIGALARDFEAVKVCEERARQKLIQNEKDCKFKLEQQNESYVRELEFAKKVKDDLQSKNDELFSRVKDLEKELEFIENRRNVTGDHHGLKPFLQETSRINQEDRQAAGQWVNGQKEAGESHQILNLKEQLQDERRKHAQEQINVDHQLEKLRSDLEHMEMHMRNKVRDASRDLTATEESRERILEKNKKLENELKSLNRKIKLSKHIDFQKKNAYVSKKPVTTNHQPIEVNEEMERLKREIKRYKLELSNREGNFNRMFTSTVPVRLDDKPSLAPNSTRSPSSADKSRITFERLPTLTSEPLRRKTARYSRPVSSVKSQWNTLHTLHS